MAPNPSSSYPTTTRPNTTTNHPSKIIHDCNVSTIKSITPCPPLLSPLLSPVVPLPSLKPPSLLSPGVSAMSTSRFSHPTEFPRRGSSLQHSSVITPTSKPISFTASTFTIPPNSPALPHRVPISSFPVSNKGETHTFADTRRPPHPPPPGTAPSMSPSSATLSSAFGVRSALEEELRGAIPRPPLASAVTQNMASAGSAGTVLEGQRKEHTSDASAPGSSSVKPVKSDLSGRRGWWHVWNSQSSASVRSGKKEGVVRKDDGRTKEGRERAGRSEDGGESGGEGVDTDYDCQCRDKPGCNGCNAALCGRKLDARRCGLLGEFEFESRRYAGSYTGSGDSKSRKC